MKTLGKNWKNMSQAEKDSYKIPAKNQSKVHSCMLFFVPVSPSQRKVKTLFIPLFSLSPKTVSQTISQDYALKP
jgi:hypothetical protein